MAVSFDEVMNQSINHGCVSNSCFSFVGGYVGMHLGAGWILL